MSGAATVEVCDNCGSPLDVDIDGRCRWCHARIAVKQPPRGGRGPAGGGVALVPDDVDDCFTSSSFLYLALSSLGPGLTYDRAVQEYVRAQPVFAETVRALATAASEAGARVRDHGLLKGDYDLSIQIYTPEEIWMFDLMYDVIAMLGSLDGVSSKTHATIAGNVRLLDREVATHGWKKKLSQAGEGPAAYRELRGKVPHHVPSPQR